MLRSFLILTLISAAGSGFTYDKSASLGEEFLLKKNETASVNNTSLKVKMISNGHASSSDSETIFCKFETKINNKTQVRTLDVGETARIGNLKITLVKVNTTTNPKNADPWSNTSCNFIVTRN